MDRQYYKGYHDVYWRGQWLNSADEAKRRLNASAGGLDRRGSAGFGGYSGGIRADKGDSRAS